MKKSDYQRFQEFKKRDKFTDKDIVTIMTAYANSVDEQSANFFVKKFNLVSACTFYSMRDFTLIFMLVDANMCQRIRDKSFRNQSSKNQSGNYTSAHAHYMELMEKRKAYLKSFPEEEIIQIATDYSRGDFISDIAKAHKISNYTVRKLLAISLANRLVSDDVYWGMKARSDNFIQQLRNYQGYTAESLWYYGHWE